MATRRRQRLEVIESVRFTVCDHAAIAETAERLRLSRADVIRRATALGISTLKQTMSLITPVSEPGFGEAEQRK